MIKTKDSKIAILNDISKSLIDIEDVWLWTKSIKGKTEEEIFGPLPIENY